LAKLPRFWRVALWLALLGLGAWGLRITILEGFVYEWPRHFNGDMYVVMYGTDWWNGSGIYYGPIFVMERWLVNAAPQVFTIYFFAFLNIPLVILAFYLAARAARLTWPLVAVTVVAWLCFSRLYYSFSVVANPEILEMTLICGAWYATTRARPTLAFSAIVLATLVKRIPALFFPILLFTGTTKRSVITGALISVGIMVLVGIGQGMGPIQGVLGTFAPFPVSFGEANLATRFAQPFRPAIWLGNAIARLLGRPMNDWTLPYIQNFALAVTALIVGYAVYVAYAVLRGKYRLPKQQGTTLSFAIFFALMPLATVSTHWHTFVFLLPTWTAGIAMIAAEKGTRQWALAALCGISYVFMGFQTAVAPITRLTGMNLALTGVFQDPIWGSLILVLGLFVYAHYLIRDQRDAMAASPTTEPLRDVERPGVRQPVDG
jgi:hypothetical protein